MNLPLKQGYDIGTLVTNFNNENELKDNNITKASIEWIKKEFIGKATNFDKNFNFFKQNNLYHHVGIYSFRYETLKKFISLTPSVNEKNKSLEQMRAIDNNMSIGVGYVQNVPISVDTKEDLLKVEKLI